MHFTRITLIHTILQLLCQTHVCTQREEERRGEGRRECNVLSENGEGNLIGNLYFLRSLRDACKIRDLVPDPIALNPLDRNSESICRSRSSRWFWEAKSRLDEETLSVLGSPNNPKPQRNIYHTTECNTKEWGFYDLLMWEVIWADQVRRFASSQIHGLRIRPKTNPNPNQLVFQATQISQIASEPGRTTPKSTEVIRSTQGPNPNPDSQTMLNICLSSQTQISGWYQVGLTKATHFECPRRSNLKHKRQCGRLQVTMPSWFGLFKTSPEGNRHCFKSMDHIWCSQGWSLYTSKTRQKINSLPLWSNWISIKKSSTISGWKK